MPYLINNINSHFSASLNVLRPMTLLIISSEPTGASKLASGASDGITHLSRSVTAFIISSEPTGASKLASGASDGITHLSRSVTAFIFLS